MIGIEFEVRNILRRLNTTENRTRDFSRVLKGRVDQEIRQYLKKNFESKGAAFNVAWPPLAPSTVAEKVRLGFGKKPMLRRTDRLFNAITKFNSDSVLEVGPQLYERDFTVEYAGPHQTGTINMPQRQLVPEKTPQSIVSRLVNILNDYIITGRP